MPKRTAEPVIMEKAALELGHITMEWARIEGVLDEFIRLLLPVEDGPCAHALYGNIDQRGKVQIILAAAFHRKLDDDWFKDLHFILNHIDNNLRVRRNAAIHAEWFNPRGRLIKQTHKTKLVRPKSFSLVLETQQNIPVGIAELRRVAQDMMDCWAASLPIMFFLYDEAGNLRSPSKDDLSWKQYVRVTRAGWLMRRVRNRQQPAVRPSLASVKAK